MKSIRRELIQLTKDFFQIKPDHPFSNPQEAEVFRIEKKKTWFALFMNIPYAKLGIEKEGQVDIVNLKMEEAYAGTLRRNPGIFKAYHMNKASWITVLLDGTVSSEEIISLIKMSHDNCLQPNKKRRYHSLVWIIPSNPSYYDIHQEIQQSPDHCLYWQNYPSFQKEDVVFIYETAPTQAIVYEMIVIEDHIPQSYQDSILSYSEAMKLKLVHDYRPFEIGLSTMKSYGIGPIRGPRHLPEELVKDLHSYFEETF